MSGSDRGTNDHFVIGCLVFLGLAIIGYGIWGLAVLDTKESISASQRASEYRRDTEQQILEACAVAELTAMRECVTEKVQASEENQRASYDLYAQNAVARWTFWMLILGLAGTGITGVGLYYLAANLNEMKEQRALGQKAIDAANEANNVARDMGQAQVRAYLHIESATIRFSEWLMTIEPKIVNTGQSPASQIFMRGILSGRGNPEFPGIELDNGMVRVSLRGGCAPIPAGGKDDGHVSIGTDGNGSGFSAMIASSEVSNRHAQYLAHTNEQLHINLTLNYVDVFDAPQTCEFMIVTDDTPENRWANEAGTVHNLHVHQIS
jgi:hypothetical protein